MAGINQGAMRLYLVRHGQTAWNLEGRAQGHTDIPLDDVGLEQAERLAERFRPDVPLDVVYTSDLLRAVQTATPLARALGVPMVVRQELRERSFGEWEGLPFHELVRRISEVGDHEPHHVRPPGGESMHDVWSRLETLTNDLAQHSGGVAVVTHGGTGSLLLAKLLRGTPETARSFTHANTGYSELERRPDGYYRLLRVNEHSHVREAVLSGSLDRSGR